MARGRGRAPDADYRAAYTAGRMGRAMPEGLASRATGDPALDAMHDAGRNGADYDESLHTHAPHAAGERTPAPASGALDGGRPAQPRSPRTPRSGSQGRPGTRIGGGNGSFLGVPRRSQDTGSGILLGFLGYALVLSLVDHGPRGPLLWIRAKFLNQTAGKTTAPKVVTD